MQQRLSRHRRDAGIIEAGPSATAGLHEHPDVPAIAAPSLDLPLIVIATAAQGVPAIPLKPSQWIAAAQPPVGFPLSIRQSRTHLEAVASGIVVFLGKELLDPLAPIGRKLASILRAASEVRSTENSHLQHLLRSKLRTKTRMKSCARAIP